DFWARREASNLGPPLGPGYRQRYEDLRRLADETYDGWRQDAGRMVIRWGEPSDVFKPESAGTFRDLEIWTYTNMGRSGQQQARFFFYRPAPGVPRKLWTITDRERDLLLSGSCRKSLEEMAADCTPRRGDTCFSSPDR